MRFFGFGVITIKTSQLQNAKRKGGTAVERGGRGNNTTCSKLQVAKDYAMCWEKSRYKVLTTAEMPGNGFRWGWQKQEGEGGRQREREADRPKRLLATLVCVCVSASSSIHNRLETRPWPLKVTSVKRAFFLHICLFELGALYPPPSTIALSRGGANELSHSTSENFIRIACSAQQWEKERGTERESENYKRKLFLEFGLKIMSFFYSAGSTRSVTGTKHGR